MANLTSGSITWSNLTDRQTDTNYGKRKKYIDGKLTIASGSTWPKAGLKLPVAGTVGLTRNLDGYILKGGSIDSVLFGTGTTTASGSSLLFSVDNTNNVLHAYQVKFASAVNLAILRMTSSLGTTKKAILHVTAVGW